MARRLAIYVIALAMIMAMLGAGAGCGVTNLEWVAGSGTLETKEMDFSGFSEVEVSHAFEVSMTRADSYGVSITADDNLFEYLDVRTTGKTLHIGLKKGHSYVRTTEKATISMPDLDGLRLSGASHATAGGFSLSHSVEFELSGASTLDINNLQAGDTQFRVSGAGQVSGAINMADGKFDLSGASSVELTGSATDVSLRASGASKARLGGFAVRNADVALSGASTGTIEVNGRLDVNLSGASKLDYTGNPTIGRSNVTGGSTLAGK